MVANDGQYAKSDVKRIMACDSRCITIGQVQTKKTLLKTTGFAMNEF